MTTQDSKQRLTAWRAEIAAELTKASNTLPSLEAEQETTATDARNTEIGYRAMQQLLGTIERMGPPLSVRAGGHLQELTDARSRQVRARNAVEVARNGIAQLQQALAQIDQLISPEIAEDAGA